PAVRPALVGVSPGRPRPPARVGHAQPPYAAQSALGVSPCAPRRPPVARRRYACRRWSGPPTSRETDAAAQCAGVGLCLGAAGRPPCPCPPRAGPFPTAPGPPPTGPSPPPIGWPPQPRRGGPDPAAGNRPGCAAVRTALPDPAGRLAPPR